MFRVAGGTGGCVASGTFALILFLTKTSTKWLKLLSGQQDAHLKYVFFFALLFFVPGQHQHEVSAFRSSFGLREKYPNRDFVYLLVYYCEICKS